jgi:anthranilate synthase component 2
VSVVLVDNYDSFTFNLYQRLGVLLGREPIVVRNDAIDLAGLRALEPTHVVVSPGPGSPAEPRDFGISREVITTLSVAVPTLGVCLGHQGAVHHLGGEVVRAPRPVHGKVSRVRLDTRSTLFAGLPEEIDVMRYHSLVVSRRTLPACFRVTAETLHPEGGEHLVMAVEHTSRPLFGVQFHPESIGTPDGDALLGRFLGVRGAGATARAA